MAQNATTLGSSTEEQDLLHPIALWAVPYAELVLSIFEQNCPDDLRPRDAVDAAREFGNGKKRDNNLRKVALTALKTGKDADELTKCIAQCATLTASVAYTHTDLQTGLQGVRQAKHILGPIVYAARVLELAHPDQPAIADDIIARAASNAPQEVRHILRFMPPQPAGKDRLGTLFYALDVALRSN